MTARPWRLTRRAEEALVDIARWTARTFGPRQAAAYAVDANWSNAKLLSAMGVLTYSRTIGPLLAEALQQSL